MKANELSVGNYVSHYGAVHKVKTIGQGNCKLQLLNTKTASDNCSTNSIEPIPLTEQWLIDFGFVALGVETNWEKRTFTKNNVTIYEDPDNQARYYINGCNRVFIKYVHQLQNLYFALTGQELERNNTNTESGK